MSIENISYDELIQMSREDLEKFSTDDLKKLELLCHNKRDELYTIQYAYKTLINSLYGALGNKGFILMNDKIAQAITGNGRYFIRTLGNNIEKVLQELKQYKGNYWIYTDTDSCYYTIEPFVNDFIQKNNNPSLEKIVKFCDKFDEKITNKIIKDTINDFCDLLNAKDSTTCNAKKEIVADRMILLKKKKYIARLREDEATIFPIDTPKIKAMGVDLIKSGTSKFSVKYLNDVLNILFDGTQRDLKQWFENVKNEFIKSDINDICAVTSVNSLNYDLIKDSNVPYNSRAALTYNNFIKKNNLQSKFNIINPGDKIKYAYLKTPNIFAENVVNCLGKVIKPNLIGFIDNGFVEYLKDYIDYDTQFEKSFISPLELMTTALNFTVKSVSRSVFDF